MSIVVQKFGGTSVADTNKIKNVAKAILNEQQKGEQVVVVVSAMGHTTDSLIKLASEISPNPNPREMDMLLASGEQVSIALLTMAVQEMRADAVSFNAMQIGIMTENVHGSARIKEIKTDKITRALNSGKVVIIAGFQGVTDDNEITTLGRGGSDTSAVATASALNAKRCDIYTDVEGIYTTDPRIVPRATKLKQILYEEMLELARVGANVLHPRAVETAMKFNLPTRVRSTFNLDDSGTLIIGVDKMEIYKPVTGAAADTSQVRIVICDVPDKPGTAGKLFSLMAENELSVDMIIQSYARSSNNTNDIAFTIAKKDLNKFDQLRGDIKKALNPSHVHIDEDIAKISIVGAGMIDKPGIAALMFKTLTNQDINIKMIATSEIKISCLVKKEDAKKAIVALCESFELVCEKEAIISGSLPD